MSETEDLRAAGDRIEQLLDQLASLPDRRAGQWGEELVRLVTDLYGAGLEATIALAAAPDAPRGRGFELSLRGISIRAPIPAATHGVAPYRAEVTEILLSAAFRFRFRTRRCR